MRNEKIGFLGIILVGLLAFSSCVVVTSITREIKFQQEFKKLKIDFENKESILRLEKDPNLFKSWTKWRPVELLMTGEEKKISKKILKIEDEAERNAKIEKFINWFWQRRDDNTYDHINEFKENFYGRVIEAQTRFADKEDAEYFRKCAYGKGWQTDMGIIYILSGEAPNKTRYSVSYLMNFFGGDYQETAFMPQEIEVWYYYDLPEDYNGMFVNDGNAWMLFEKEMVDWRFGEQTFSLFFGYENYYNDPYYLPGHTMNYSRYLGEVYKFIEAVAESYIYDWDLEFDY